MSRQVFSFCSLICLLTLTSCSGCEEVTSLPAAEKAPGSVFVLAAPSNAGAATADERHAVGWWPRLAKDSAGNIHLAYCDAENADLDYAFYDGASWVKSVVISKGKVGKYLALAVDGAGGVHVTFYDQDSHYYNYGYKDAAGWHLEKLSWGKELGVGAAMAIDSDNLPHVIFYGIDGRLIYMHRKKTLTGPLSTPTEPIYQLNDEAAWETMVIGNYGGGFSARSDLAFGPDNKLHASFVDSQLVKSGFYYATLDGGSWRPEVVADKEAPGWNSQIIFNGKDVLLVYGSLLHERLYLSTKGKSGTWQNEILYLRLGSLSAAMGNDGTLYIAHQYLLPGRKGYGLMRLLSKKGAELHWYEIDKGRDSGMYLDMLLDKNGRPVIAYFDPESRSLKVYMEK